MLKKGIQGYNQINDYSGVAVEAETEIPTLRSSVFVYVNLGKRLLSLLYI